MKTRLDYITKTTKFDFWTTIEKPRKFYPLKFSTLTVLTKWRALLCEILRALAYTYTHYDETVISLGMKWISFAFLKILLATINLFNSAIECLYNYTAVIYKNIYQITVIFLFTDGYAFTCMIRQVLWHRPHPLPMWSVEILKS